jgi:hypothetical protein
MTKGIRDTVGLEIHPLASSLGFTANGWDDTLRPAVASFSLKDSVRGVDLQPTILITFYDATDPSYRSEVARLTDSSGRGVPLDVRWLNDITLSVTPAKRLQGKAWYRLNVAEGWLRDFQGSPGRDTVHSLRFMTIDPELFSSVEGVVSDISTGDTVGTILLRARQVEAKQGREYEIELPKPGPFVLTDLIEGRYVLEAVRDRNRNGKFDPGVPFPFKPSERFVVLGDTLKLRARWPLDGVRVELK